MSDPLPEITRVKGSGSARIGIVVLGIALVTIVGVGILGRQAPAPVAVVPPAASPAVSSRPTASPRPASTPSPSPTPVAADTYGASLTIGNVRYVTIMSELTPDSLSAELHFPSPPRLPVGTLEFSELWKNDHVDAAMMIGSWQIDLEELARATSKPANVLESTVRARPNQSDKPPPVRAGYRITADGSNDLLFSRLTIQIVLGKHLDDPGAAPNFRLGVEANVAGNRRSAILEPAENGSFKASFTLPRPRRSTTGHLLLFTVQLTVSHDVWTRIADLPFELAPDNGLVGSSKLILDESGPGFSVVARTQGHAGGQSITVTVIARASVDGLDAP